MKCLAIAKGINDFHVFYETPNAQHDFLSTFKEDVWKISYGFNASPAKKITQQEKQYVFNVMMGDFFKENILPKNLSVLINGVTGTIVSDFCRKYGYKVMSKNHVDGTKDSPMDKNYYQLKRVKIKKCYN